MCTRRGSSLYQYSALAGCCARCAYNSHYSLPADLNYVLVRHLTCKLRKWHTDRRALWMCTCVPKAQSHVRILRGVVLGFAFAESLGLAITLAFTKALVFAFALWLRA